MFCSNCGSKLEDDALFCGECGARVDQTIDPPAAESAESVLDALFAGFSAAPADAVAGAVEEISEAASDTTAEVEEVSDISSDISSLVEEFSAVFAEEAADVEQSAEIPVEKAPVVEEISDTVSEPEVPVEEVCECCEETAEEPSAPVAEAVEEAPEEAASPAEETAEDIAEAPALAEEASAAVEAPVEEAGETVEASVEEAVEAPVEEAVEAVEAPVEELVEAPAEEDNRPMLCPACGAIVAPGSLFCSTCGSRLNELTPAEDSCMEIVTTVTPSSAPEEPVAETSPQVQPEEKRSFRDMASLAFGAKADDASEPKEKQPGKLSELLKKPKTKKTAEQVEEPTEQQPKKLPKKALLLGAAAAIVVIALVCLLATGGSGRSVSPSAKPVLVISGDDSVLQLYQGSAEAVADCDSYLSLQYALDSGSAVVLTKEGELYLCKGGKSERLAEEVVAFQTSRDCSKTAYLLEGDEGYDLYLTGGSKTKKIASDVLNQLAISPDGDTIAYAKRDKNNDARGYVYNGKEHELGKGKVAFAVSDGAKYIYYTKENISYCQNGINSDEKTKLGSRIALFCFNKDYTEVLYISEGNTYISVKGGDRTKLCATATPFFTVNDVTSSSRGSGIMVYGVSSFIGANLSSYQDGNYKLYRIDKGYETHSICKASKYYAAANNSVIYYQKNHTIYSIDPAKSNAEGKALVQDVDELIAVTADGKSLFYVDEDGTLYQANAKGKSTKITSDTVDSYAVLNGEFCYVSEGELYRWNGTKSIRVTGLSGDVERVTAVSNGTQMVIYTEDDVWLTLNLKAFAKLYER